MKQGNKDMPSFLSAPISSPGSLVLEGSSSEGQFTEVVRKKRKIVERSFGPLGDRGRRNLPHYFNKLCNSSNRPPPRNYHDNTYT